MTPNVYFKSIQVSYCKINDEVKFFIINISIYLLCFMKYVLKYCNFVISLESPFYVDYKDVLFESVGTEVKE